MNVYILTWNDYEYSEIRGIYDSLDKAIENGPDDIPCHGIVLDTKTHLYKPVSVNEPGVTNWNFGDSGFSIGKFEVQ